MLNTVAPSHYDGHGARQIAYHGGKTPPLMITKWHLWEFIFNQKYER